MDEGVALDSTQLIHLRACQYVSAAGLVVLLWDHLLTFSDEVRLIWGARWSVPKILFLFNRYIVPIAMIIQTYGVFLRSLTKYPTQWRWLGFSGVASPHLTNREIYLFTTPLDFTIWFSCKTWTSAATILGILSIGTSNFLVLLRLWVLWDRRYRMMIWTLSLFVLTQVAALGSTVYLITQMIPVLVFIPSMQVCLLTEKVDFALLWYPGIAFEVMIFVTTLWNAVDRPRVHNIQMAKVFYRDGSAYFFILFGLRLVNLILAIAAPLSLIFLGVFFIWCSVNVTLTRLIINLRRVAEAEMVKAALEDEVLNVPVLLRNDSMLSQSYELQTKDSR
ncbi:hypothetical protein BJ138DRAFT_1112644 [Hygrophoropsis aurantiaca]|uniref:Uncharacterized protein n=1 Tax=Hygrophoropsis aurantiaca TaxID=72124 RepID=A0ACB8AG20_9AGAM|nr:hypothetical protein BJ138DRAFT_1112644 [Hygrophoropsis aurantiaca]